MNKEEIQYALVRGRSLSALLSPLSIRVGLATLILANLLFAFPIVRYGVLAEFVPCPAIMDVSCRVRPSGKPDVVVLDSGFALSSQDALGVRGLTWAPALLSGAMAVRISGVVRPIGVGPGKTREDEAQVVLVQHTQGHFKSWVSISLLSGTQSISFDRVIPLLPTVDEISLLVRLVRVSGRLEVGGLRFEWLAERPIVRWARYLLMAVWGVVLALLALSWMRHALFRFGVLLALVFVLAGVLMPGDVKGGVEHWMMATFSLSPINEGFSWSDLAHVSMFFGLALVLSLARPDFRPWQLVFDLLLFAACTEALQLFVEGRQAGFDDIGLDLLGSLLGVGAVQMGGVDREKTTG